MNFIDKLWLRNLSVKIKSGCSRVFSFAKSFLSAVILKSKSLLNKIKHHKVYQSLVEFKNSKVEGKQFTNGNKKLKSLIYSCVALSLIIVMLVAMTSTWLMNNYTTNVGSDEYIMIDADAGLNMNYGDQDNNQGAINIKEALASDFKLVECSSVDGRNFFFPLSEFTTKNDIPGADGEHASNNNTQDMKFREGTENDKNNKYISIDFSLSAQDDTDVWLSGESFISVSDSAHTDAAKSIRLAFVENKVGGKSVVFDNAESIGYVERNAAVSKITNKGILYDTAECDTHSLVEYQYGNAYDNKLFHITAGETLNITMNIWLEGTDSDTISTAATNPILNVSDLNIKIKFTTSYEDMRTLYFVDHTLEKWVDDDNCYVFAIDENNVHHQMEKSASYDSDYTWSVDVPNSMETVEFVRYNPSTDKDDTRKWNYWPEENIGITSTYNAFGHSAGMWANSFAGTTITLFDGTPSNFLPSDDALMHVQFSTIDGNGNNKEFNYKMSHQNDRQRWQIVIPSAVDEITFNRVNPDNTSASYNTWVCKNGTTDTSRNNRLYYTATSSGVGYWSNDLLYLDGYDEEKGTNYGTDVEFVAYFYASGNTDFNRWVAMRSTTPEKGRYIVAVPPDMNRIVFTRYKKGVTEYGWNSNMYNQTLNNLEDYKDNNLFIITGYTGDNNKYLNGRWETSGNP